MEQSSLSLKIRARYGDLVQTFDRRKPEDTGGDDSFALPVPHIRTFLAPRRAKSQVATSPVK